MPIRAVAFDIDGTLYPNAGMYLRSVPFALGHMRLIRAYSRIRKHIRTIRPIRDFASLERELLARELETSDEEARRLIEVDIHQKWEGVFERVRPFPYVRESIEALRSDGLRVAVTSDFPVDQKLERMGLSDLFECSLWSVKSGYLKPHPEPFQALVDCFDDSADKLLYVGNSYEYDILGAKGAGMRAAHVRRRPVPDSVADFTFYDYRDLVRWVREINTSE